MWNARLNESQARIMIAGRDINNLRYANDITLMAESEEEENSFLKRVKEKSEKAGLKLNMKKKQRKKLRWYPVTSLYGKQKGKKWKQWQILFSWAPKSLQIMAAAMKLKDAHSSEGKLWTT